MAACLSMFVYRARIHCLLLDHMLIYYMANQNLAMSDQI